MENIILINPPGEKKYLRDNYCGHVSKGNYLWQPYDLMVLASYLKDLFYIQFIDAIAESLSVPKTILRMEKFAPKYVFILVSAVSLKEDLNFIKEIGQRCPSSCLLVLGDVSFLGKEECKKLFKHCHGVVRDFACNNIGSIIQGISSSKRQDIFDYIWEETGKGLKASALNIGRIPHEYFLKGSYRLPHTLRFPMASMSLTLGCPFSCSYCPMERVPFRVRQVKEIIEELLYLEKLNVKEIWFKDQSFGLVKELLNDFCEYLITRKTPFTWSCEVRPGTLSKGELSFMKRAGCHTVFLGIESADIELLKGYNKTFSQGEREAFIETVKEVGLLWGAHFILGLPGETIESMDRTLNYAMELDPDYASFNIASPTPGTSYDLYCRSEGWVKGSLDYFDYSVSCGVSNRQGLRQELIWDQKKRMDRQFFLRWGYIKKLYRLAKKQKKIVYFLKEGLKYFLKHFIASNK